MSFCWLLFAIIPVLSAGTVIDQIAAVVDKHPIKTSDIDRDVRVTEFLNGEADSLDLDSRKKALQRLIDQQLIRNALIASNNTAELSSDAQSVLDGLAMDRFNGSETALNADLRRRHLTREEVLQELQWQMVVLRFIDQRFRPGVIVSDDDVKAYYNQHLKELQRDHPKDSSLEALTPSIRESLTGERINAALDDWLKQARTSTTIEYKLKDLK